jgi:tetratricopeptide (TPR) repeat protein
MLQTELYRRGYEQLKAGNYDEAKRLFLCHEEESGTVDETRALVRQAETLLALGDLNGAATLYEQLVDRNPSLPEVYVGLARISLFTGQQDEARVHSTAAVRLGPELGLSWMVMGLVHEAAGELETALRYLRKAAELSPSVFLCQFNLGRALVSAGHAEEGIAPLREATALEPENPDGFSALGIAFKQAREDGSAIRAFEKVVELAPASADAWATLADVLFAAKEFQAARDVLDRGLAACGDHPALLERARETATVLSDTEGTLHYVARELRQRTPHARG